MIDRIFTRDSVTWTIGLLMALLGYVGAHTSLCPPEYAEVVKDSSGLLGVISAYLKSSPAPHSDSL